MSTTTWTDPITKQPYPIGTCGFELAKEGLSGVFADIFRTFFPYVPQSSFFLGLSIALDPNTAIPTYGQWGGPGWSGGN